MPPRVKAVLESRLAQLSLPSRELVGLAAVIGREFDINILARASDRDENTLVGELDELWQRRIIREHGQNSYDFSHDKLREIAYHTMCAARQRLLHHRVARALEELHAATLDPVSHQVALHYELAGLSRQAIPYYWRAVGVARQVYANDEAISLLQRGISLIENDNQVQAGSRPAIPAPGVLFNEEMGDIMEIMARHAEAIQAYLAAKRSVTPDGNIPLARLSRKVGVALREQSRYEEALDAAHQAELSVGLRSAEEASGWWDEWLDIQTGNVWAYYWLAKWPEMESLVNQVHPIIEERGAGSGRMHFLLASCLLNLRKQRYVVSAEMLENSRQALALSGQYGGLRNRVDCQFELGFLLLWRREFEEASLRLHSTLEIVESAGIVPLQTLCLTYLAVLNRFQGQLEAVKAYTARAHKAAAGAQMPDYIAAAHGNLAWLAWRRNDLEGVHRFGREALDTWRKSPLVYPFQWLALWPLIAAARMQNRAEEALSCACALLEPTQQLLPEDLKVLLDAALEAQASGRVEIALAQLDRALQAAHSLAYL
jgi:hypothetical protein